MFEVEIWAFSQVSWLVGFGTDFFSNVFEEKLFLVDFVEKQMGMDIFSRSALTPLWSKFVKILNFMIWYSGTRAIGLDVCFDMVGCRHWLMLVVAPPGLRLLRILPRIDWRVMCCENGFQHRGWKVASLLHVYLNTIMFGLMVVWSLTILLVLLVLWLV